MNEEVIKNAIGSATDDMEIGGKMNSLDLLLQIWEKVCETWQVQVLHDFVHFLRNGEFVQAKDLLDRFSLLFAIVFIVTFTVGYVLTTCLFGSSDSSGDKKEPEVAEERPDPRDFTIDQLREFNGVTNSSIYVALKVSRYMPAIDHQY